MAEIKMNENVKYDNDKIGSETCHCEACCSEEYARQYQVAMQKMKIVRSYMEKYVTELEPEQVREVEWGLDLLKTMEFWIDPKEVGKVMHAISVVIHQIEADLKSPRMIVIKTQLSGSAETQRKMREGVLACQEALFVIRTFFRNHLEKWADE